MDLFLPFNSSKSSSRLAIAVDINDLQQSLGVGGVYIDGLEEFLPRGTQGRDWIALIESVNIIPNSLVGLW